MGRRSSLMKLDEGWIVARCEAVERRVTMDSNDD